MSHACAACMSAHSRFLHGLYAWGEGARGGGGGVCSTIHTSNAQQSAAVYTVHISTTRGHVPRKDLVRDMDQEPNVVFHSVSQCFTVYRI